MSEKSIAEEIFGAMSQEALDYLFPRDPRYRYWEAPDKTQFHYTVEPMGDGKYASAVYVPRGKGARSGNPARLEVRREVHHRTRRAAKQRAYKLYSDHLKILKGRELVNAARKAPVPMGDELRQAAVIPNSDAKGQK